MHRARSASSRPTWCVMDYRLPGLDGAEATRAVRAAATTAVVCLTAEATAEERDEILARGSGRGRREGRARSSVSRTRSAPAAATATH